MFVLLSLPMGRISVCLWICLCLSFSGTHAEVCSNLGTAGLPTPLHQGATIVTLSGVASGPTLVVPNGVAMPFPVYQQGLAWSFSMWLNPLTNQSTTNHPFSLVCYDPASASATTYSDYCNAWVYNIGVINSALPEFNVCNDQSTYFNEAVTWGAWNHLLWTYDGATNMSFYLNGTKLPYAAGWAFVPVSGRSPVSSVRINQNFGSTATTANLSLSSTLRVYNRELTPCEALSDSRGLRQQGIQAEFLSQFQTSISGEALLTDVLQTNAALQSYFPCSTSTACSATTMLQPNFQPSDSCTAHVSFGTVLMLIVLSSMLMVTLY